MKPFRLQEVSLNETCSAGKTDQYLSDVYRREFCLKQEDVSALFRLKCTIVYGIREVPANEKSLKLNETLEILFSANEDNLLGENKRTFCEGNERGFLLFARIEVSLVANAEVKARKFHNPAGGKTSVLNVLIFGKKTLEIRK